MATKINPVFSSLMEKFKENLDQFSARHSPLVVLRLLNQPSSDFGLLIFYLHHWLGSKKRSPLDMSFVLNSDQYISSYWMPAACICKWIVCSIEYLFSRFQKLILEQPSKESIDELEMLLASYDKLQKAHYVYHRLALGKAASIDSKYLYLAQFWKANLFKIFQFSSFNLHSELGHITIDILQTFKKKGKGNVEKEKLNKIISLNFLVQKLRGQFTSEEEFSFNVISGINSNFTIRQMILILSCYMYKNDPLAMCHFTSSFSLGNNWSKRSVNNMLRSITLISNDVYETFQPEDQFKIQYFVGRLKPFCSDKKNFENFSINCLKEKVSSF